MFRIILIIFIMFICSACQAEQTIHSDCIEEFFQESDRSKSQCAIARLKKKIEDNNDGKSKVALGNVYTKLGEINKAKKNYRLAIIENDSADAAYNLAQIYFEEEFNGKKFKNTIIYLKKADEHGVPEAQLELSYIYSHHSKEKDLKLAILYLMKAAKNNKKDDLNFPVESVIEAQLALGKIFMSGIWRQNKNLKKGKYWIGKAVKNRADKLYGVKK